MKTVLTLCIVHTNTHVLLGLKKRGFGEGRWNGLGGHVEAGETIEEAALREVKEEAGIALQDCRKCGVLTFEFENNPQLLEVHVFRSSLFSGNPTESDEMQPQWFAIPEIPFDTMWPDDRHWLPMLLDGKNFRGHFLFRDHNTILRHNLEELPAEASAV